MTCENETKSMRFGHDKMLRFLQSLPSRHEEVQHEVELQNEANNFSYS